MGNFQIYDAKLGTRFFVHYDGALRECKLIGYDFTVYGAYTKVYVYMGKNNPCVALDWTNSLYRTMEDALKPNPTANAESMYAIRDYEFTRFFLKGKGIKYQSNGSPFVGYIWDGSKANAYSVSPSIRKVRVRLVNDEMVTTFLGCNDAEVVISTKKWYQSAEECCKAHTPKIVLLDEDEEQNTECTINISIKCNIKDKENVLDKIDSIKLNYSVK